MDGDALVVEVLSRKAFLSKVLLMERCQIKGCKQRTYLTYYKKRVCYEHWLRHCDEKDKFDLKIELNIRALHVD